MPNVELYVSPNYAEVNAYAVGSLRRKSIIITVGLLEKIKANSSNVKEYVEAVRGILGHEMSHLANHDYLPGLLTSANEVANCQISRALRWAFILIANCFRLLPQIGWYIHVFIVKIYNFFNFFINFFYRYIFMPIYNFICKWLSRSIEYRCDKESAYAFGGEAMARALSILGEGYYFSVFSTHPRTKSRIKNIQNVSPIGGVIRPRIFNSLSNLLSIALVLFVCVYSTQKTDVPAMYEHYLTEIYYPAQTKVAIYKQQAWSLYYTYVKPNM
jgi:Zn-dependent protease with chaperone function